MLLALAAAPALAGFYAAAGKTDISPDLSGPAIYLAGHGEHGRRATAIHDPLYAHAVVLSDGKKTIAIVSVDLLGTFRLDVERIRRELGWTDGLSYLFLTSSHTHSAPDNIGLWGPRLGVSGVEAAWHATMLKKVVELVKDVSSRLRPAKMQAGELQLNPKGLCYDARPPIVIDPDLVAMRFTADDGQAIGTVVRWSCHAEAAGRLETEATADFPGAMCRDIEKRDGGTCLFVPGAIGGMMQPVVTADVTNFEGRFMDVERIGKAVADAAERALKGRPLEKPARLEFSSATVRVPIENSRYLLFLPVLAFGHDIYDSQGRGPLTKWQLRELALRHALWPIRYHFPQIDSEVSHLWIGPVEVLGLPSEAFPELILGGYDGQYSFGQPIVPPDDPNAPDITQAPRGPYLKQLMTGRYRMQIGLANDMLGYLIPAYDFKVTTSLSMLPEPDGSHYEETNSVGRAATSKILKAARELLKSSR